MAHSFTGPNLSPVAGMKVDVPVAAPAGCPPGPVLPRKAVQQNTPPPSQHPLPLGVAENRTARYVQLPSLKGRTESPLPFSSFPMAGPVLT